MGQILSGASLSDEIVVLIFVCANGMPYVIGVRAGISFKPLIARSNAPTGGEKAIGPVDWAIFSDSSDAVSRRASGELRSVAQCGGHTKARETTESENSSCLLLNSSSVRDVRQSRRSPRLWP